MAPRINIALLIRLVVLLLIVPVGIGVAADIVWDTLPFATMVVSVVFIPLSTVFVVRAVLHEFDKVIQQVAPPDIAVNAVADSVELSDLELHSRTTFNKCRDLNTIKIPTP